MGSRDTQRLYPATRRVETTPSLSLKAHLMGFIYRHNIYSKLLVSSLLLATFRVIKALRQRIPLERVLFTPKIYTYTYIPFHPLHNFFGTLE